MNGFHTCLFEHICFNLFYDECLPYKEELYVTEP